MNLNEVDKPEVKKTVVVYAGRFQPFHKGHYDAYRRLVSKFGADSVYIGTSNDQSSTKSPFGFKEKKEIATKMFGIPSSKFVQINNPYKPVEILKKFDGKTTQYIAAVGEKDATRLQGNYFKAYKGKAGYGYDEIGYVYPVPAEANPISGTDVRKGLGNSDNEKAKKFFLKAYPKFDKDIFKMIKDKLSKLNEEGLPGGIGTGLVLPGGYINGAPTGSANESNNTQPSSKMRPEPHPTRHEREHPSDEPYNPIAEIIQNHITNEMFEEFVRTYFNEESEAEKMGLKHLGGGYYGKDAKGPATHKSDNGKIRTLTPAEADDANKKSMAKGPSDAPANQPKPSQPGQPVNKGATAQGQVDAKKEKPTDKAAGAEKQAPPPPEQKLGGVELKDDAELSPEEKEAKKVKEAVDAARKELSKEDNETIDKVNNPESAERKGMMDRVKSVFKKIGKGAKKWWDHKTEMVGGSIEGVKSLAKTGSLGSVKDKDGKDRSWSEFTQVGRGGGHAYEEVESDVLDSHGQPTGKKKKEKKPIWRDDLSPEEKELAEESWNKRNKQVKHMKHFALDMALLVGSMALGGAGVAAAAAKGVGTASSVAAFAGQSAGQAAAAGATGVFTHGLAGFGIHLGKDLAKHSALEVLGMSGTTAAVGGAGLSVTTGGILEMVNEAEEINNDKFIENFMKKVIEKMETYKLSDKQLLKSIQSYKKNKPKQDAADLLKENLSETKQKSIQHFVEYATKRLKLKETPKVTLLRGQTYSENQSSLGGYNPQTKEIYVQIENRLGADILRTIAHEMVHRKQDEMGLVKNPMEAGKDGSPIENQAHAVAGILMREYGRINKQIYTEQMSSAEKDFFYGHSDDHIGQPAELDTYDFDDNRKKKPGYQANAEDDEDFGYEPVQETIKKIGDKYVVYPKNGGDRLGTHDSLASAKKQLAAIEINKEDINLDVDKGDTVLMGKFKNKKVQVKDIGKDDYGMPTINGKKATTFRLGTKAGEKINEMGRNDIHLKNLMKKYRDASFRKRINAYLFGKPNMNNPSEVAKRLIAMNYDEITQMEKKLNIHNPDLDEVINTIDEVSNVGIANTADIPDGSFLAKGKKRKLNSDKGEDWYVNGGYTQTDFPKADAIFGDEDGDERIVKYTIDNLPRVDFTPTKFIKEGLLLEGGAYGHMSHPFDDMDLTFGDLKNIITNALEGELGVTREKTDGQALAISWKNGRLIAARNKGHLQNAGANALGIEGVASKFAGRGGLTDAYNYAMKDLSAAISSLSQKQREKIFGEGTKFMNIEVIWPTSVNVIPYGQALLVFHNCIEYDEKGTAIGKVDGAESMLAGMIKQINANVQSKYTIQGPPITSIPKNENLSSKKGSYLSKLNKLQNEFGCSDSDTMAVYHQHWWENFIDKNSPVKVDKITKDALIRRWAFGDKSFRLNTISNPKIQEWAMNNDKVNVQKQQKENIKPFEEIFLGVGADVLQFVGSVLTVHPDKAIRSMKDKLKSVAQQVRTAGNPAQIAKLKSELARLNQLGGIDKIVANEGLVFFYNGKTYKLTGTFAPLNQILGIFYQ